MERRNESLGAGVAGGGPRGGAGLYQQPTLSLSCSGPFGFGDQDGGYFDEEDEERPLWGDNIKAPPED